jgi:hypothetical protein
MATLAGERRGRNSASKGGGRRRTRPTCGVRDALSSAVAEGIARYVPGGVGILAIGIPACSLASFLHFVLGVSLPATVTAGAVASVGHMLKSFIHAG